MCKRFTRVWFIKFLYNLFLSSRNCFCNFLLLNIAELWNRKPFLQIFAYSATIMFHNLYSILCVGSILFVSGTSFYLTTQICLFQTDSRRLFAWLKSLHTICALLSRKPARSNPIKSRKAIKRLNRRRVNGKPRSLFRETRREKRGSKERWRRPGWRGVVSG